MTDGLAIAPYCPACGTRAGCGCGLEYIDPEGESRVSKSNRYDSLFQYYAGRNGLDWQLIKKQAVAESSLNPTAISPKGAIGLMQFMPNTWQEWGQGSALNPEASIKAGCAYMRHLIDRFGEIPDETERYKFALAAYNAGRGNINRMLQLARESDGHPASYAEWNAQGRKPGRWQSWDFASAQLEHVTGRNHRETIDYVRRIIG